MRLILFCDPELFFLLVFNFHSEYKHINDTRAKITQLCIKQIKVHFITLYYFVILS